MTATLIRPADTMLATPGTVDDPSRTSTLDTGFDGVRFLLCPPNSSPFLWAAYREGAEAAYAMHGVMAALRLPDSTVDDQHPWFAVGLDTSGEVVAGLRVNGPLGVPSDAAALRELSSSPSAERRITDILAKTLSDGVIEIKGFWVANGTPGHREIAATLTGCTRQIASIIGVRHALCTAAEHAAGHWRRAGGVPLMSVPAVPYPTPEYSTRVHWWDSMEPDSSTFVESVPAPLVPAPRVPAARVNCRSGRLPADARPGETARGADALAGHPAERCFAGGGRPDPAGRNDRVQRGDGDDPAPSGRRFAASRITKGARWFTFMLASNSPSVVAATVDPTPVRLAPGDATRRAPARPTSFDEFVHTRVPRRPQPPPVSIHRRGRLSTA